MMIELKGMYDKKKTTELNKRGRSFLIAQLNGSVQILDHKVQILISSSELSKSLNNYFQKLENNGN